ncbi:MAG: hypothetical protein AAGD06_20325 [Acidobacteriota bacterium]
MGGEHQAGGDQALLVESGVDGGEPPEALHQQAGAGEEHQGEGHLNHHQAALDPRPSPPTGAGGAAAVLEAGLHVETGGAEGGQEAEEHAGGEAGNDGEGQHRPVDAGGGEAGHGPGDEAHHQIEGPVGQQDTEGAAGHGEGEALRQQLLEDPAASGSEGGPHRQLPAPSEAPDHLKGGDIQADDRQQPADGPQQHHQALPLVADGVVQQGTGLQGGVPVAVGVVGGDASAEGVQHGAGGGRGHVLRQAAEDADLTVVPGPVGDVPEGHHDFRPGGEVGLGGQDADHCVGLTVEPQGLLQDVVPAAEVLQPEPMLEDHHLGPRLGGGAAAVLAVVEQAAEVRGRGEELEELLAHPGPPDLHRLVGADDLATGEVEGPQHLERVGLGPEVQVVGPR